MDDQNKNLILAMVLSLGVILLWYTVIAPPPPADPNAVTVQTTPGAPAVATPATVADPVAQASAPAPDETAAFARIPIATPRLQGSISLLGGRIDDLELTKYKETLDRGSPFVRMLAPVGGTDLGAAKPYYAVYGWLPAGGLDAALLPGSKTPWTIEAGDSVAPGKPLTLRWDNGAGQVFRQIVEVDDHYLFTITQSVENTGSAAGAHGALWHRRAPRRTRHARTSSCCTKAWCGCRTASCRKPTMTT